MIGVDFLTGGHAIFTVSNPTGEYYTYRVTTPKDFNETSPIWFVSLLTGPNNLRDYTYLGIMRKGRETGKLLVTTTAKSKYDKDSKPVKVIKWAVAKVEEQQIPEGYDVKHIGRCGRCGRELTTPESIDSGIGPICAGR